MAEASSQETFLLIEHAAGYCVALVKEWNAIGMDCERAQDALTRGEGFSSHIQSKGWIPFKNAEEALQNLQDIRDSKASPLLVTFLAQTLPKKKKKYQLGCCDQDLAKTLNSIGFSAFYGPEVFEVVRWCKFHIKKLVPTLDETTSRIFQIGLGHAYSRCKIKFDPARQDKNAQQAISLMDMIDKALNKFAMRVKEWYGWHFPELMKIANDNILFAKCALLIGVRDEFDFTENKEKLLAIFDGNEEPVHNIGQALKSTMGQDLAAIDMANVKTFAKQVLKIGKQRKHLASYLSDKMELVAPNLKVLVGDALSARLITQAGGLTNLAKAPASTIQILGAEKALFRALKSKGPTPKYGLLFQSSFIARASVKNKGRISRFFANKIAIASRIDAFGGEETRNSAVYGTFMKEQMEERLRYLVEGVVPRKNADVMRLAAKKSVAMDED